MTTFRVAVVDKDENGDDVVFQWTDAVSSLEDAQAKVSAAQAANNKKTVRVERLDPVDVDEATGQVLESAWNEVTE